MKRKVLAAVLVASMSVSFTACGDSGTEDAKGKEAIAAKADESGNYVVNGSFEEPDFAGWTVNNVDDVTEEIDVYERETDCHDGMQCLHYYSTKDVDFSAEQTLTGLEAGTYRLTGYVQGDTAGDKDSEVYFYAVTGGETLRADVGLKGYLSWITGEIPGISVEDGNLTIGVAVKNAPGGWGTIDSITLVKE